MGRFFEAPPLDGLSFWLGVLAASLLWWVLARLRPQLSNFNLLLRTRGRAARLALATSTEKGYRRDILRLAQRMHLAAPLFALDEVLVPPRLIQPPPPVEPGKATVYEDITTQALPYLPDWPELAAAYGAATLTLDEALQGNANLVITGWPGSGKTVALAHLASQIARQDARIGNLSSRVPFLVHIADLSLPMRLSEQDPLERLIEAVLQKASTRGQARLQGFLRAAVQESSALLLLDGLDELPPDHFREACSYLGCLIGQYPSLQVVTTASEDFYDGLAGLGFIPAAVAAWDDRQRHSFILQWSIGWEQYARPVGDQEDAVDPLLLKEWLLNEPAFLTPLELTLKAWAAFAGDAWGGSPPHAIESYLQRMAAGISKARPALEWMAGQMALSGRAAASRREIVERSSAGQPVIEPGSPPPVEVVLPALVESGLLRSHSQDKLAFIHPVIAGYLAGCALRNEKDAVRLFGLIEKAGQPEWTGRTLALESLLFCSQTTDLVTGYLEQDCEPLHQHLFYAGRWLRGAPEDLPWRDALLRGLAQLLQNERSPASTRARALAVLATSNSPGVHVLFRQLLTLRDASLRQLAALGIGLVKDIKSVHDLMGLFNDPAQNVRRAACLALVRLGGKTALEAVSDALLHGDEDLRRAAAEALANHPAEGCALLKEASRIDDLLVRRAAIYGLQRVREPWALEILESMQIEDAQWVVKNAAAQAVEESNLAGIRPLHSQPPLTGTAWLIAFAGERGMGVAPGKAAVDLLLMAIKEGDEDQRLAALDTAGRRAEARSLPIIEEIFYAENGDLRESALTALRRLSAAGFQPARRR